MKNHTNRIALIGLISAAALVMGLKTHAGGVRSTTGCFGRDPGTAAPGDIFDPSPPGEEWRWPRSSPESQGLDPAKLHELVDLIGKGEAYPRLHCLLIIRNGQLVVEEYFKWEAEKLHTLQSVSKSFTSALVGIAIDRGAFKGVEEKLLDFFPDLDRSEIAHMDENKASIRLRDLLTMRSGTDYHESGPDSPHFQLNALRKGWDRFYIDRPMRTRPGTAFLYDSGAVIITSSLLKNRTGKHADLYASDHLFKPLQITNWFWFKNSEGHPHTGGGLNLKALDTAKLGQLYLDGGRWEGKQIVPEAWVEESTRMHVDFEGSDRIAGYGYWWWILQPDPDGTGRENIYAAMGFKAQYIFVIPEHNMVVVVNGDTQNRTDQRKPIEFLYTHILAAVRR
jgi:CubicO group peptidase (beta-lactamase class C family)